MLHLWRAKFCAPRDKVGVLAPGFKADFVAIEGNPLDDISILLDRTKFKAVVLGGQQVKVARASDYDPRQVSDFSFSMWSDLYTQRRVKELGLR